jgi:diguanylate cyclase (GGDEF)-like protein
MTTDSLPAPSSLDEPRTLAPGILGSARLSGGICLVIANVAVILLIRLATHPTAMFFNWWTQMILAIGMLFTSTLVWIHLWRHWSKPTAHARDLLVRIRAGEASIGELGDIRGGIAPVLMEVQEILRELRRQKAEIARIELETTQRIANRTDALERSLGTVRRQATRDSLTGLFNRRLLDELLPRMFDRCRAEAEPLSLMMIDVDDFKLLNDTLGHAAGDDFLRSLGQLIRSTIRDGDMAFRYGGDELVLLLPNNSLAQAGVVRDRLVSLVDALVKPLRVARPPRLSIGLVSSNEPRDSASGDMLLQEADRLLYDIKLTRQVKRRDAMKSRVA